MRFGLVGTGYWAGQTQAAALAAVADVNFVGVWGRDARKTAAFAAHAGVRAFDDVAALFDDVDAVAFAVPPDVQSGLAERAARMGKHLFLEKPIALSSASAAALADAVHEAGVASVVLFTARYTAEVREWLASLEGTRYDGGTALWLANAFAPGSPFDTPWRRDKGGLWDVAPHVLSLLTASLGRVTSVHAVSGRRDLVHLAMRHADGATSTAAVTLTAPDVARRQSLELWGPTGFTTLPASTTPASVAAQTAVRELMSAATDARPGAPPGHPCDVEFGRYIVDLLAEAQRQLDSGNG